MLSGRTISVIGSLQLDTEFELLRQMLKARQEAGLTQAQVAERMGTKAPAVTRLESSLTSGKHSPSLATLRKYAQALGFRLEIHLVRAQSGPNTRLQRTGGTAGGATGISHSTGQRQFSPRR